MDHIYIDAQITNIKAMLTTFEQSCKMAAMKTDGRIDKNEEKILKKISVATQKYKAELDKIMR